ncbi:MAG: hypothetical protein HZB56_08340 [Deltaproteobacteria bacterium]|nr:hypothetical protein [Deltaproteobacteria bacterium]
MPPVSSPRRLVIVVRPGERARTALAWLRQLFPAALLLLATPSFPDALRDAEVVTLDADAVEAGPLALADAVLKGRASQE